jgi:hypothetical protein
VQRVECARRLVKTCHRDAAVFDQRLFECLLTDMPPSANVVGNEFLGHTDEASFPVVLWEYVWELGCGLLMSPPAAYRLCYHELIFEETPDLLTADILLRNQHNQRCRRATLFSLLLARLAPNDEQKARVR